MPFLTSISIAQEVPTSVQPGMIERSLEVAPKIQSNGDVLIPSPISGHFPDQAETITFTLSSLSVNGVHAIPQEDILGLIKPHIGKKVSLATLFAIANEITLLYSHTGYALSVAYVPAQKIGKYGKAVIEVVEGFISNAQVVGADSALSKRQNKILTTVKAQKPVKSSTLERSLLLMNDIPGLEVKAVIGKDETSIGGTRLTLNSKVDTLSGYVDIGNRGSTAMGPAQMRAGLNINAPSFNASSVSVNAVKTIGSDEMTYISGSMSTALGISGTRLSTSISKSDSKPGIVDLRTLEYLSNGMTYTVSLSHPWIRSRTKNLSSSLSFTARDLDSSFLGVGVTDEKTRSLNLTTGYDWITDTGASNLVYTSINKGVTWLNATPKGSETLGRGDSDPIFTSFSMGMQRVQPLAPNWSVVTKLMSQYSLDSLSSAQQCGYGGSGYGRGYDSFEIAGDHCLMGSVELDYTLYQPHKWVNHIQFYGVVDMGKVWTRGLPDNVTNSRNRKSISIGARASLFDWMSTYLEAAKPLGDPVRLEESSAMRLFTGITARF